MGKRVTHDADGAAAFRKRQKITHEVPVGEDVQDTAHLRQLLSFDQDMRKARHGLQSFKNLLDCIRSDDDSRRAKLNILAEYLEDVKPRNATDDDAVYLSDIMEMWSFAVQVHDDNVASSVAVALALLLQIVSGSLDLVPHGLGICRTLLQDQQLKSLSKNLSAPKGSGFIISPTLRVLTEAVCIDGGAFAKRIFRARDSTFASLGRNLELGHVGDGQEDRQRASIRTNAVRFLLSCVKYLHSAARKELLSQREWISHLTYTIKSDPPYLALDILDSLKTNILMDEKIDRPSKLRAFNTKTLMRVLALYASNSATSDTSQVTVGDKAHEFLSYIATTQGAGILYPATGLYPKTADEDQPSLTRGTVAASSSDLWAGTMDDGVPVYNFVLSEVAQKLRPWSNAKHSELLVSMFMSAPELISDYFYNSRSFTFEPKLTMTWIGYAAFLFNTMMIPLPPSFGDRVLYATVPPPVSILLDNIIPPPVNQKVLSRCLNPESHLTSFFATRILVVALEKLTAALELLQDGFRSTSPLWKDSSKQLVDDFCRRVPDMVEIVRSYKAVPAEHFLHRTLASRLLRLYYEVVPRVALAANFDVSPFLAEMLKKTDDVNAEPEAVSFGMIELENLVSIASYSPGMRWFTRPAKSGDSTALSPFSALLRLLCQGSSVASSTHLKKVLDTVAVEHQVVSDAAKLNDIYRALQALRNTSNQDLNAVWQYVDNSITRCASTPIKYVELLEAKIQEAGSQEERQSFSLLGVALAEQLSFATASASKPEKALLAKFLSLYFSAADLADGKKPVLRAVYQQVRDHLKEASAKASKLGASEDVELLRSVEVHDASVEAEPKSADRSSGAAVDATALAETLHVEQHTSEDNTVLIKWVNQSVEDLLEDDWAARLIHLLLSPHVHIRKEALTNLLKLAAKVKESSYEEKDQIWLLLSELAESSTTLVSAGPVPSPFVAFTTHAIEVLRNPLHVLYPKVNTFLTRGPVWSPDRLPLAPDVLHGEPSEDDRYYAELAWLLTYLLDALRTPVDLAVFHRRRWFEKILALASNPYVRTNLRQKILRIVYRATEIEGGSTTLATRFGVFSWLGAQRAVCDVAEEAGVYDALVRRVWETCDQDRVRAWSQGGVEQLVERVSKI
ncbi:nucleolar pre-ribosomal-associated protein 1 domain-containing protein [Sarocladium implicatum]|nr:nucleolar pre-ribosomal-associated protein 1 domain-containing protein [Sarocladium implicatum]